MWFNRAEDQDLRLRGQLAEFIRQLLFVIGFLDLRKFLVLEKFVEKRLVLSSPNASARNDSIMRSAEKPSGGGGRGGLRTTGGVNIFEFVPLATQIQGHCWVHLVQRQQ